MNTTDPNVPGAAQLEYLQSLKLKDGILLQHHISWDIDEDRELDRERLLELVHELSGQVISIAPVDLLAIGNNPSVMDEIWLIEFSNAALVYAYIESPEALEVFSALRKLEIIVASAPSPRMRRMVKWMNRLIPLLPAYKAAKEMPEAELSGGINPTRTQFEAFQKADQTCPVHMFNLLKFHKPAQYEDGDRGRSGRRAYEDGYGRVAMECLLRLKGRIIMLGRYRMTLVGASGEPAQDAWNEIAVIQYPNRPAFVQMVSTPKYIRALEHRHAGLAKTEVWSTAPTVEYCQ